MNIRINRILTFQEGCVYLDNKNSYFYKLTSAGILPLSKPNGKSIFFDRGKLEDTLVIVCTRIGLYILSDFNLQAKSTT